MKKILFIFLIIAALFGTGARRWIPKQAAGGFVDLNSVPSLVQWQTQPIAGAVDNTVFLTWPDSKTSGTHTMVATATYGATYKAAFVNGIDMVSFQFNGTNNAQFQTGGSTSSTYPYTLCAEVYLTDLTGYWTIFGPSGTGGITLRIDQTTGHLNSDKSNVANIATGTGAVGTGGAHFVMFTIDTSGNYAFYIDNTLGGSGTNLVSLTGGTTFKLGADSPTGSDFRQVMGDPAIFSTVLTTTERNNVYNWYKTRYASP